MKRYNLINNVLGWVCFVIAALTYLLTLEPTASFWDCPEFISQGAKLEVGHPPGNPIFMLAARFMVTLFGNDISRAALAVNAMSALLSAATIMLLFWTITHLVRRLVVRDDSEPTTLQTILTMGAGLCGALVYTWSDTFWFSAVEAEVYAFSSFCTALVFWLILKWENRSDEPHSDRYLILIAYVIGVSIAVHLLNLLCIPAIGLVIYFRKSRRTTARGSLITLVLACVVVGAILYGLVPGFVKVAQWFELLCVNSLGMSYNMGVLIYAIVLVAVFCLAIRALYQERSAMQIKVWSFVALLLSGLPFIGSNTWVHVLLIAALAVYLFLLCRTVPVRIFNIIITSVFVIFIGYSSYALLLIRASANPPMNQNAPDNVFALSSYLNREQYGDTPLFLGAVFAEELDVIEYPQGSGSYYVKIDETTGLPKTRIVDPYVRDENYSPYGEPTFRYTKVAKTSEGEPDHYVKVNGVPDYKTNPDLNMLLPRMHSSIDGHIRDYKAWTYYSTPDLDDIPDQVRQQWAAQAYIPMYELAPYLHKQTTITTAKDHLGNSLSTTGVWKPDFWTNLRFFINYQLNHMYWRYFMWNFAGRQNDFQGNGEPHLGNWISGIPFIDNARLGDQTYLPDEFGKGNKGHNVFYMLPLLLGLLGLLWQAIGRRHASESRGIEQFWVIFFLFFMTGIAIVLYLNQVPGQPRERDYAFAGSFYAFAIWVGMGVPALAAIIEKIIGNKGRTVAVAAAAAAGIAVPVQMLSQTYDDHDRSGRYTARDYGMNYLSSLDPDAIILTYGDNDTFPLWYAQEVEGYRTDVRVVNSSYLTAGWYADQQRHPYYHPNAIPMLASPEKYAYGKMDYVMFNPVGDRTPTPALDALEELWDNPETYFDMPLMSSTNIVMPIDSAVAVQRYHLDSRPDSAMLAPYLGDITLDLPQYGSGMILNRTLLLDILAHTVDQGWKRPFYVASTVPTDQYSGLQPYTAITGMAYEITPFYNAPINPNLERAYENVLGSFRWGGLDSGKDIYLDETVRRMVGSTRIALITIVEDLLATGDMPASQWAQDYAREHNEPVPQTRNDMARRMLQLMDEKLPNSLSLYDNLIGIDLAGYYINLYGRTHNMADLDRAEQILNEMLPRYAQKVRYAQSLDHRSLSLLGYNDLYSVNYLGAVLQLLNRVDMARALADKPDMADLEEIVTTVPQSYDEVRLYPLLIYAPTTADELTDRLATAPQSYAPVIRQAAEQALVAETLGIDLSKRADDVMKQYGINPAAWLEIVRLLY